MFVLAQLPLADIRPLLNGQMGRLPVPDWKADNPGDTFIRGFGQLATRNSTGYGLVGERAFADFDQAVRIGGNVRYRQEGWPGSILIRPWFRRLYFDGQLAGRFEFGFLLFDGDEDGVFGRPDVKVSYAPAIVAETILNTALSVHSSDIPTESVLLSNCEKALGLAYIAATTRRQALQEFPPAETYGTAVAVGHPILHIRISNDRPVEFGRDRRELAPGTTPGLFITSAQGARERNNVVVQISGGGAMAENGQERATRVLFSHFNSLIFAYSHFLRVGEREALQAKRDLLKVAVTKMIERFNQFALNAPKEENDDEFSLAIRTFGKAYSGRVDQLVEKLEAFAAELGARTALGKTVDYVKSLLELAITTAVTTTVEGVTKVR